MTACNNLLPAPKPVPGQKLTEAQLYEQKRQQYQEEGLSRRQRTNANRRVEFALRP